MPFTTPASTRAWASIPPRRPSFVISLVVFLLLAGTQSIAIGADNGTMGTLTIEPAISQTGTISFVLEIDKTYRNGAGVAPVTQSLVSLPGLMEFSFRQAGPVVNILWTWEGRNPPGGTFHDIIVDLSELPGPSRHFLQYTWDSARGISEGYLDGMPLRVPGARFDAWWVTNPASEAILGDGPLRVRNLAVRPGYTPPRELAAAVPAEFIGKAVGLIGFPDLPQPLDVEGRRGALLYEASMTDPASLDGWVDEGALVVRHDPEGLLMTQEDFAQHTVFWCPQDFPPSFIAEWSFKPLSRYGLAIIFFSATGENGEDIFDPSLPERDGAFIHYIRGAITSYHISYFANVENYQMGRTDSNMRKNNQFYKVGGGPIAVPPGSKEWHHMRLVKDDNRIQLFSNGRIVLDWRDDDPERYGNPLGGGKIGLRQMTHTVALYRDFRVWALETYQ